jgi:hypothetical protein
LEGFWWSFFIYTWYFAWVEEAFCEIYLYTHVIFYLEMKHMSWRSSLGRFFVEFLIINVIFT